MTEHRVFIFNPSKPTRRIVEMTCRVVVCDRTTWAEEPSGRRHLLGSSAFYTLKAAYRAKRGALEKILQTRVLERMPQTQLLYHDARRQLVEFQETGSFALVQRGTSQVGK